VTPQRVIGETLVRATNEVSVEAAVLAGRVRAVANGERPAEDYEGLAADPLAVWVEDTFGLVTDADTGSLVHRPPTRIPDGAADLAAYTGERVEDCTIAVRDVLLAGSRVRHPSHGRPLFAFRLHQFVSKGSNVYASLEPPSTRHLSTTALPRPLKAVTPSYPHSTRLQGRVLDIYHSEGFTPEEANPSGRIV
jgi:hypothetical protein